MKLLIPILVIFILLLIFGSFRENYKTFNTPLNLEVGEINNKHIISKDRITIKKGNKLVIGKKEISQEDIIAFKSLPLHYNSKMCLPDEDGECIDVSDLQNLKNYWNDGTIIAYSGELSKIPPNWYVCDGENGTPNLKDRFIVGAGTKYKQDDTGGEKTHSLTLAELPRHNHNMAFPSSAKELDTSKPEKVGDIRYGRHGDHLGKYGDGVASMCKTDGYGNPLKLGKDYIPGNNLQECVSNIYATKKDSNGRIEYRNKLSKQSKESIEEEKLKKRIEEEPPKKGIGEESLKKEIEFIDTDIYEPVPFYDILYENKDKIKAVGFRQDNAGSGGVAGVCSNTCIYFRDTRHWESEINIKDKTKMWMKSILIKDENGNKLGTETNLYPEFVKTNVKSNNDYYVGPTGNACKNCHNTDATEAQPINYNVFQAVPWTWEKKGKRGGPRKSLGIFKLSPENISVTLDNKVCYNKYKEIHDLFWNKPSQEEDDKKKCYKWSKDDLNLLALDKKPKEVCERTDREDGLKYEYNEKGGDCGPCKCCYSGTTTKITPKQKLYESRIGFYPTPNWIFSYLTKYEGTPCLNNDTAVGNPHDNMPSFYRVIFLMRNVNYKPPVTIEPPIKQKTKPKTKKIDRCTELIDKLQKAGVPPVYLNCD